MQWHLFTQIWNAVGEPLNGLITAVYTGLFAWIRPGFKGGAVLFMAFSSGLLLVGRLGDIGRDWIPVLVRVVLVACILNVTFYNAVIRDTFLHAIPDGLVRTIATATGGKITPGGVPDAFDKTFIDAMAAGIKIADSLSSWSPTDVGRAIFIYAVYMPLAALAIFAAFAIWFVAQFILNMLVGIGPIFIAFLAFSATRRWFEMWISAMAGTGLLQGLVMLALGMIIAVETTLVKNILTMDGVAAGAGAGQIVMLMAAVSVYALFGFLLTQIPSMASSVIGGTHAQVAGISRTMFSQPLSKAGSSIKSLGNAVSAGAASINSRSRSAVGASNASPPGRPLGGMRRS